MSLPVFSTQGSLFSTAALSASLFADNDRYRLFAKLVYPKLAAARPILEKAYCLDNGRIALEPVLMLGVSLLQEIDGVPDRQAVELLRYHAGWNFALNRQLGDEVFHSTSLVNFRQRLDEHQQNALAFTTILSALQEVGLVSRQCRQRLDSTQIFGRVARMSRLDCVRESLRLALQELEALVKAEARPLFWLGLWERYVESQADFRVSAETLARKLAEAGADAHQLLEWLRKEDQPGWSQGTQVQLLKRVFNEQFEIVAGAAPTPKEKEPASTDSKVLEPKTQVSPVTQPIPPPANPPLAEATESASTEAKKEEPELPLAATAVQPRDKKELATGRVCNPHDPEATYATKGQGDQRKEHVGYKVQVAESVSEAALAKGEPTRNFITGIVTQAAHESDELGEVKMEQEQARMGMEKPPVHYVDGAYISAQKLAEARAQGREMIGPAQPAVRKDGRFTVEDFTINIEQRTAVCPAGKTNTQCSRLDEATGKVNYRFEFSTHCHDCPLRGRCLGKDQRHRTILVGQYHDDLQARRLEQKTDAFKQRMKHRNGIEGTQSELVRGHGMRRARYRGLSKMKLQNYFIGAACNVKRWIRREMWLLKQASVEQAGHIQAAAA